jgi:hypothetical protein
VDPYRGPSTIATVGQHQNQAFAGPASSMIAATVPATNETLNVRSARADMLDPSSCLPARGVGRSGSVA